MNSHPVMGTLLQATRSAPVSPPPPRRVPGICRAHSFSAISFSPRTTWGWLPVGPAQPEAPGTGANKRGLFKMASRHPFQTQAASSLFSNPWSLSFKLPAISSEFNGSSPRFPREGDLRSLSGNTTRPAFVVSNARGAIFAFSKRRTRSPEP